MLQARTPGLSRHYLLHRYHYKRGHPSSSSTTCISKVEFEHHVGIFFAGPLSPVRDFPLLHETMTLCIGSSFSHCIPRISSIVSATTSDGHSAKCRDFVRNFVNCQRIFCTVGGVAKPLLGACNLEGLLRDATPRACP